MEGIVENFAEMMAGSLGWAWQSHGMCNVSSKSIPRHNFFVAYKFPCPRAQGAGYFPGGNKAAFAEKCESCLCIRKVFKCSLTIV